MAVHGLCITQNVLYRSINLISFFTTFLPDYSTGFLGKMEKRGDVISLSDVTTHPAVPSRPEAKRSIRRRGVERANTRVHAASELIIVCELRPCFITAFCVNRSDRCKSCSHYRDALSTFVGESVFRSCSIRDCSNILSIFFFGKDIINISCIIFIW